MEVRGISMKVISPNYKILTHISKGGIDELMHIEKIGRICYKSEDKITPDGESAKRFVSGLIARKHEAMLEHSMLSIKFVVDRGVSHELVRHRLAGFAQESTRYCNYSKDRFGGDITFISPMLCKEDYEEWLKCMSECEKAYMNMISHGCPAQIARSVLPNSLKTEIVMTANYREWRHFFKLRAARETGPAHPQMEQITIPLLCELKKLIPVVFDDITP